MKHVFLYLTAISVLAACGPERRSFDLIISNVSVIDPVERKVIPGQSIFILNDSILSVENFDKSALEAYDATIIDGTGKFALAGFWNMHTHVCWMEGLDETLFPTLLAYGITGVRDMGGDTGILNRFKKKLSANPSAGPALYGPGPLIDGNPPIHPGFSVVLTEENYLHVLDSLRERNVDFLKVYSLLPGELVAKVSAYSRENRIPFAGHISEYLTPLEAAHLGQKSFEHLNRIEDISNDSLALDEFIQAVKSNNQWVCPTLIIYKRKLEIAHNRDLSHPLDSIIDDVLKNEWARVKERREAEASDPEKLKELDSMFNDQQALVRELYTRDVPLLIGSDFGGMAYTYPGIGLHEEMELFQELGFNTYDILKMATYNPAVFLGITHTHGTVEKGKVADLVVLNESPVNDIRNTSAIHRVIKSGRIIKAP